MEVILSVPEIIKNDDFFMMIFILKKVYSCSSSHTGGNQVDGLPPVLTLGLDMSELLCRPEIKIDRTDF